MGGATRRRCRCGGLIRRGEDFSQLLLLALIATMTKLVVLLSRLAAMRRVAAVDTEGATFELAVIQIANRRGGR